jgi:ABC-type transport system involved in cytochrome bd biosynthesis fused ATPase/permease subunit
LPDSDRHASEAAPTAIPLHRATARITPDSIAIKQTRAGLIGPLIEIALTLVVVWVMVTFINSLPLIVLVLLLLLLIVLGPLGIIGLVNNLAGTSFLMEREKYSARWQQGLLGMGIGTYELVPFNRIQRFEVVTDYDDVLGSGIEQDVVHWEVVLVKDNDRELAVGSVVSARLLALEAGERANALAEALGEMSEASVVLADLEGIDDPEADLDEDTDLGGTDDEYDAGDEE